MSLGFYRGAWRAGNLLRGEALSPCAEPLDLAVERGSQASIFLRANQGEDSAPGHGNVGMAGQFQHAQGVQGLFVAPLVAGDHGDAQHLDVRSLKQRQQGHLVGAAGTSTILIDEDEAFLRRAQGCNESQQKQKSCSVHG